MHCRPNDESATRVASYNTMSETTPRLAFGTRTIHAGQEFDPTTGAVMTPIYATSTYAQQAPGVHKGFEYSRTQNPTRFAFERCVADLEEGAAAFAFASGMAATATVLELLEHGSHVVVCDDLYGGTYRLFERVRRRSADLDFTYVDPTDLAAVEAAIRPNTRMIWMESPSNPLLKLADLAAIAGLARRRGLLAVADNTFASPYCQRPLSLGFDIVVHSVTKYLNGHSDMVGGVAVVGGNAELQRAAAVPAKRRGRRQRPLRQLPRPARPEDAQPAAWSGTVKTPCGSPSGWKAGRAWPASSIPACRAIRNTPWPGGR